MANIPSDLRYTKDHEWIRTDGKRWRVGITEFAAKQLGDIVFVDVQTVGKTVEKEDAFGTIESVKSVSELFMPVGGKIVSRNEALADEPELVNQDPFGEGWIVEIEPSSEDLDELLDADAYEKLTAEAQ
jgi:glycine cleavage system H protein